MRQSHLPRRSDHALGGFTLVEILVSLSVLLLGMVSLMKMVTIAVQSSSFSRHATEAAVLAEDKMEAFRTVPIAVASALPQSELVDAKGRSGTPPAAQYTRSWSVTPGPTAQTVMLTVNVAWKERGEDDHAVSYRTLRAP